MKALDYEFNIFVITAETEQIMFAQNVFKNKLFFMMTDELEELYVYEADRKEVYDAITYFIDKHPSCEVKYFKKNAAEGVIADIFRNTTIDGDGDEDGVLEWIGESFPFLDLDLVTFVGPSVGGGEC